MRRAALIVAMCLTLTGCSTFGGRVSYVETPDGKRYKVRAQHDARVSYKDAAVQIEVDNRGRPSWLEQAIQAPLVTMMNVGTAAAARKVEREAVVP